MSSWWVEAHDIPGVGVAKRVDRVPAVDVGFTKTLNRIGAGRLSIPSTWPRLHELNDPDNDDAALLKVFIDGTLAYSFYADKMTEPYEKDGLNVVTISGGGIEDAMSFPIVYPYDYPSQPTVDPDWKYGSKASAGTFTNGGFESSILNGNEGAENGDVAPFISTSGIPGFNAPVTGPEASIDEARTGTYSFKVDPNNIHSGMAVLLENLTPGGRYAITLYLKEPTASGLRYTAALQIGSGFTIHHLNGYEWNGYAFAELDNVARNPLENGEPGGSTDGTWQQFDLDVTIGSSQTSAYLVVQFDDHIPSGQNGPTFYTDDFSITGTGLGLDPWIDIQGDLTKFEQSATRVEDGSFSALIQTTGSPAGQEGIRQEITDLVVGAQVTASAFISHDDVGSRDFKLVLKRPGGAWLASQAVTVPSGTSFTSVELTAVLDTDTIWLDIRDDDVGASSNIYIDSVTFGPGLPRATFGAIMRDLMLDASFDHSPGRLLLEWVDITSFDDLLDSNGTSWANKLSLDIPRGQRYTQVLSRLLRWNYEWEFFYNQTPDLIHGETAFGNPGGLKTGSAANPATLAVPIPDNAIPGDIIMIGIQGKGGFSAHYSIDAGQGLTDVVSNDWTSGAPQGVTLAFKTLTEADITDGDFNFTRTRNPTNNVYWRSEIFRGFNISVQDWGAVQRLQNNPDVTLSGIETPANGVTYAMVVSKAGETSTNETPNGTGWVDDKSDYISTHDWGHSWRKEETAFSGSVTWSGFPSSADLGLIVLTFEVPPRWELRLYEPGGMGTDRTLSADRAILEGQPISKGNVDHWVPPRNHVFAEGAEGIYAEIGDSAHKTGYSRREHYVGDDRALDASTVSALGSAQLTQFDPDLRERIRQPWNENMLAFRDVSIGDKVKTVLRGHVGNHRIYSITADLKQEVSESFFTYDLNSEVVSESEATLAALERLLEEFEGLGQTATGTSTSATSLSNGGTTVTTVEEESLARFFMFGGM